MRFSKNEVQWLEKYLQQRVSIDLWLDYAGLDDDDDQLLIIHNNETLELTIGERESLSEIWSAIFPQKIIVGVSESCYLILEMLLRVEEYKNCSADSHERFPAIASNSFQSGTLERPIVDELFEVIRQSVARQWPYVTLTKLSPTTIVTCDVDNPYEFYTHSPRAFLKKIGGDLLKRNSFNEFSRTWRNYIRTARGDYSSDPNNTFDWMMDVNENAGNKMAFYFLVDKTVPAFDAHYSIDEPGIRKLIRRIYDRGHEIGLHASYGTFKDSEQMKKEADKLRQVMDEEGIKQDEIGSRQHFLRWSTPETARYLEAAGIAYDTTLGYADHAGFRCGTSHEFPMFDIENQKILNLRERPLILMEASVLNAKYMNKGYCDDTLEYMKSLKDTCHRYGGTFTMLWHNSHFLNDKDKAFYQELVGQ